MTKKELRAILNCLRAAKDTVETFGTKNYPYTDFEDREIREMYYRLNDMCITISDRL